MTRALRSSMLRGTPYIALCCLCESSKHSRFLPRLNPRFLMRQKHCGSNRFANARRSLIGVRCRFPFGILRATMLPLSLSHDSLC
ncbi:hypothetical protein CY34DRAFT_343445 [Suillus luteus UH-Slu-Lm8-n1]|uniref:Uncharacterized protein n=1 Tax=Suillus luteus UH-Slu-Lm8-n1 TaxID=930992 RepID=A0A0C9ZNN4_9AGAM|nr:hypothetical protein CY34DRAFT_343445 [Suillus luteus UH-Slu-Lm8-n1]